MSVSIYKEARSSGLNLGLLEDRVRESHDVNQRRLRKKHPSGKKKKKKYIYIYMFCHPVSKFESPSPLWVG